MKANMDFVFPKEKSTRQSGEKQLRRAPVRGSSPCGDHRPRGSVETWRCDSFGMMKWRRSPS